MQKLVECETSLPETAPPRGDEVGMEEKPHCVFPDTWNEPIDSRAKQILGGKGAEAIEMIRLRLPVPPLFIVPTDIWSRFKRNGDILLPDDTAIIDQGLHRLEHITQTRLGDPEYPLFISARSSPRLSMPGQMTTVINVGLNKTTVGALKKIVGEEEAERLLASLPQDCPEEPQEQIQWALTEVLKSWDSPSAKLYRAAHSIPEQCGPAAIIQQMVWGNSKNEGAWTGVLFTRNPQNYSGHPVVSFVEHAQGPAVVGNHHSNPLMSISELPIPDDQKQELENNVQLLEKSKDLVPQDVEITCDGKTIWYLQTRDEQLSPIAQLRSVRHRIDEGFLTELEAMCRIPSAHLNALQQPTFDPDALQQAESNGLLLAKGLPLSMGAQVGRLYTSLKEAQEAARWKNPENIILADSNLDSFSEIPDMVGAVILPNASAGSHFSVEAVQTLKNRLLIPVLGVTINPKYERQIVSVDANSGNMARIFLGDMPFADRTAQSSLLTPDEHKIAQLWRGQKEQNPWRFLNSTNGIVEYEQSIQEALAQAQENIRSKKALEYIAFNAGIPENIRQPYSVVPVASFESMVQTIKPILAQIFAEGNHATIRTCHDPAMDAGGPWALTRNMEDFLRFLHDPRYSKYGSFENFLANRNLTEILVGNIPPGKMEDNNQFIQHRFAAWILSCLKNGILTLQVHPHSAHLRRHEKATREDLVTFTTHFDPNTPNQLSEIRRDIGDNLKQDEVALTLAEISRKTIFEDWWTKHSLPQRMAAIANVLGVNPVLEGQAQKKENGDGWCGAYGMKTR